MAEAKDIARALIRTELPNREIAGILLELADVSHPEMMPTPPAAASVEKLLKRGWSKIATAVISGAEEYLGLRLAKHSSLQVRRLLAEHTSDQATLQQLHLWALEKDSECFAHTLPKVDAGWMLDQLLTGTCAYDRSTVAVLGRKLVQQAPERFNDALQLPLQQKNIVLAAVADEISLGNVAGWDLPRLFAELTTEATDTAARITMHTGFTTVTESIVDAMLGDPTATRVLRDNVFSEAKSFDTAAARKLIKISESHALQILSTEWDHILFGELLELRQHAVVASMLGSPATLRRLTKDEVSSAIMSIVDEPQTTTSYRPTTLNNRLLKSIEFDLDEDVLLAYLRLADDHATWEWLTGSTPQQPRPGEASRLISNPGFAFGYERQWGSNNAAATFRSVEIDSIAYAAADHIDALATLPWCDEVIDACGSACVDALLRKHGNGAINYLSGRIHRELGDSPEVWRDAVAHLSKTRLSIGKTMNAVRKLRSMATPEYEPLPVPPAMERPTPDRIQELQELQQQVRRTHERINTLRTELGLD